MRIIHVKGLSALSAEARERLEQLFNENSPDSLQEMRNLFPNHIVKANFGHIRVLKKDGTIVLDALRDGTLGVSWYETKVPLKVTL